MHAYHLLRFFILIILIFSFWCLINGFCSVIEADFPLSFFTLITQKERSVREPHDHRNLCRSYLQDASLLVATGLVHVDPAQTVTSVFPLWHVQSLYTFTVPSQNETTLPATSCGYSAAAAVKEAADRACHHKQSSSICQMIYTHTHTGVSSRAHSKAFAHFSTYCTKCSVEMF